jgi:hypothetical protein
MKLRAARRIDSRISSWDCSYLPWKSTRAADARLTSRVAYFSELSLVSLPHSELRQREYQELRHRFHAIGVELHGSQLYYTQHRLAWLLPLAACLYPLWILCFQDPFGMFIGVLVIPAVLLLVGMYDHSHRKSVFKRLARDSIVGRCPDCKYQVVPFDELYAGTLSVYRFNACSECGSPFPLIPASPMPRLHTQDAQKVATGSAGVSA